MHPFAIGKEYLRPALLEFVGSRQAQTGVIWGSREPGCVVCTSGGRHGRRVGYADGQQDDGSWLYVGQGGAGDQSLANAANAKLASGGKSVLLFTTREPRANEVEQQGYGKLYSFRGCFNVLGFEFFVPETGPRKGNRLIRFFLVGAEDSRSEDTSFESATSDASALGLAALRLRVSAPTHEPTSGRMKTIEYRSRSAAVHRYALLRAVGSCECCGSRAPFESECGVPYLEIHHLLRLADDGPDAPSNVAAVCPNCHRALHLAKGRQELARLLLKYVEYRENEISLSLDAAPSVSA